jgi:hypothetical protein
MPLWLLIAADEMIESRFPACGEWDQFAHSRRPGVAIGHVLSRDLIETPGIISPAHLSGGPAVAPGDSRL